MALELPRLYPVDTRLGSGASFSGYGGIDYANDEAGLAAVRFKSSSFAARMQLMPGVVALTDRRIYVVYDELPATQTRNGRVDPNFANVTFGHSKISAVRSPLERRRANQAASDQVYASVIELAEVTEIGDSLSERNGYHVGVAVGPVRASFSLPGPLDESRGFTAALVDAACRVAGVVSPVIEENDSVDRKGRTRYATVWKITTVDGLTDGCTDDVGPDLVVEDHEPVASALPAPTVGGWPASTPASTPVVASPLPPPRMGSLLPPLPPPPRP